MYLILDKIVCSNARMARHHENDLSMVNVFLEMPEGTAWLNMLKPYVPSQVPNSLEHDWYKRECDYL